MSLETIKSAYLELHPEDYLLDLGCGEGRHTISVGLETKLKAIGLDLSYQDLQTARGRLKDFDAFVSKEPNVGFIQGSGHDLPFADQIFNKVICSEVLEHIPDFKSFLREIRRVIKPGGIFAVSVPTAVPEWICWQLSDAYHEVEGGHVRIFNAQQLHRDIEKLGFKRFRRHKAHALHVPYWWLKCLFWREGAQHALVDFYHRFLVWDLMKNPWLTRWLDRLLNPLIGKSIVMYYVATDLVDDGTKEI